MTKLDKPVVRLTKQLYRGKAIVVELCPHGVIAVKRYKSTERITVPFEALFEVGQRISALGESNSNPDVKLQKRRSVTVKRT